jgi:hypothetical protein
MAVSPEITTAVDPSGGPEDHLRRLDRLNPLIHDLLAWDLVYEDELGTFQLRPEVQRRLAETAAKAPRFAADVYVGRHCERCGVVGITRLTEGMRLCDPCAAYLQAPEADVAPPTDVERRRRWIGRARRYPEAG